MNKLFLIALLILLANTAYAEYRWIGDSIYVPLRSGAGSQYRILNKGLKTGTRLTVISKDPDSDWTHVRTERGQEGYVQNQYLMRTPTAAQRLAEAEQKLADTRQQYQELKSQLSQSQSSGSQLTQNLDTAQAQVRQLTQELDELKRISSDAVNLHNSNRELTHNFQLLQTELDVLKAENQRLQNDTRNTFFVYGAAAVLLGVIIALVVPNMRRKKRYSEWA